MADERKVLIHLDDVKMHFPIKKEHIFQKEQLSVKAVDGLPWISTRARRWAW